MMHFVPPPAAKRTPSVLPLLGVSLLPTLLVLAMVCFSLSREEETSRLPTSTLPRPPIVRETPVIALHVSRQGGVTLGGQAIADAALAAAWQRELAALRLLGSEPSQATVVVRADPEVATDKVQRLIEQAQEAGFSQCVLRPADVPPPSHDARGPRL
jgi:biopolymer transport protein ExbD